MRIFLLALPLFVTVLAQSHPNSIATPTPTRDSSSALSSLINSAVQIESTKSLKKRTYCAYFGTCTYLYGSGYYSAYGDTSYYSSYNTQTDASSSLIIHHQSQTLKEVLTHVSFFRSLIIAAGITTSVLLLTKMVERESVLLEYARPHATHCTISSEVIF